MADVLVLIVNDTTVILVRVDSGGKVWARSPARPASINGSVLNTTISLLARVAGSHERFSAIGFDGIGVAVASTHPPQVLHAIESLINTSYKAKTSCLVQIFVGSESSEATAIAIAHEVRQKLVV